MLWHASLTYWLKVHLSALAECERDYDCMSVQVGHVCCMTAHGPRSTVVNGDTNPTTHHPPPLKTRQDTVAVSLYKPVCSKTGWTNFNALSVFVPYKGLQRSCEILNGPVKLNTVLYIKKLINDNFKMNKPTTDATVYQHSLMLVVDVYLFCVINSLLCICTAFPGMAVITFSMTLAKCCGLFTNNNKENVSHLWQ